MVDTKDLKSFGSNAVRVRVSSWAHFSFPSMNIFDSHFHSLIMRKNGDLSPLPTSVTGIDVSADPFDIIERIEILKGLENVSYSVGSGPWRIADEDFSSPEEEAEILEKLILEYDAHFIGECGLDLFHDYGSIKAQRELFLVQIMLSNKLNRPIIIHSRDAAEDTVETLEKNTFSSSGIMHCFSYDKNIMKKALDKGLYISFSGNVTYRKNDLIRESAIYCPSDRILYETDSPYLSPMPMRGKKNRPEYTEYILSFLSEIRKEDKISLYEKVIENYKRLLSLSEGKGRAD